MDNVRTVNVKTSSQQLIHEVLDMVICQILAGVDHTMHIRLHEVSDNIDIFVPSFTWGPGNINKSDDVFMFKKFQKFDLTNNSFSINQVLKGLGHLFNSHFVLTSVIVGGADHTVGAVTDLFDVLELVFNKEGRTRTDKLDHALRSLNRLLQWLLNLFFAGGLFGDHFLVSLGPSARSRGIPLLGGLLLHLLLLVEHIFA